MGYCGNNQSLTKCFPNNSEYRLIPPSCLKTNFRETPLVDAKLHPFSSSQRTFYFSLRPRGPWRNKFQFVPFFPPTGCTFIIPRSLVSAEPTDLTFWEKKCQNFFLFYLVFPSCQFPKVRLTAHKSWGCKLIKTQMAFNDLAGSGIPSCTVDSSEIRRENQLRLLVLSH